MLQKYRNYKCFDPNKTILGSSHRKMNEPVTLSYFMFSKKATKFDKIFTVDLTLTAYCLIDGEYFVNFCGLLRKHKL